jgi:energy-coupling factor transporter ATP-binding protein EcfA2
VAFGPRNLGYPAERVANWWKHALAMTGLSDQRETNPYDLSPTWRKMVALASVIAMDTPIVILDEPTTGQDAPGRPASPGVAVAAPQGKTVITITHDIDFCAENFERVVALSRGRCCLMARRREVLAQEEILATTYVDPPQLTRLGSAWDWGNRAQPGGVSGCLPGWRSGEAG